MQTPDRDWEGIATAIIGRMVESIEVTASVLKENLDCGADPEVTVNRLAAKAELLRAALGHAYERPLSSPVRNHLIRLSVAGVEVERMVNDLQQLTREQSWSTMQTQTVRLQEKLAEIGKSRFGLS